MLSAGRVLIKPEGEYSPLKTYEMLDYVSYNGSSYIAKKTTTGNLPTNTEYWQLSASGAQSQNVTSNFAEVEGSDIASSPHAIDDVFVNKDGKLLKATLAISIGDTIVIDTNCEPTTVEDLISYLSTQVSTLDSSNKKLNGITEIAVQTDLHTLSLGEFYKDKTSFYVTNGPEEVDEVASAIFRLTVESALDGSSTTRLLTLKTPGGKVYTQNYDGSSWGDWEQVAFESKVELKQNITDNNLQTTSKTVPGAINELFLKSQVISNPNLLDNPWFTVNQRGVSGTITADGYFVDRWTTEAANKISYDAANHSIIIPSVESSSGLGFAIQILEPSLVKDIQGKTVTMSAIIDGALITKVINIKPNGQVTDEQYYPFNDGFYIGIYINDSASQYVFRIRKSGSSSVVISAHVITAVKLELGAVSTLAMDTAPNYATELLKCQRYFYSISGNQYYGIAMAAGVTSGRADAVIYLPIEMRGTPTVPTVTLQGTLALYGGSTSIPLDSNINVINKMSNTLSLHLYDETNKAITPMASYKLMFNSANSHLFFSADL